MYIFCVSCGLVLLIICSAFFSSSETAYLSIPRTRIRQLKKEQSKKTQRLVALKSDMDALLTVILIGNNFVNTLASSAATALAVSLAGEKGTIYASVGMTILLVIFGEILPKTIAGYKSEEIAGSFAPALNVIKKLMAPAAFLFKSLSKTIAKLEEKIWKTKIPLITEEELKTLIDVGSKEGTLEHSEKEMLYKIFEFSDLRARDIMKHRSLVSSVKISSNYDETVKAFAASGYSRLPVFKESADEICGLVHYKDVLFRSADKHNFTAGSVMRPVLFVPETKTAVSLLHLFKSERQNFAVIIDEHGSISGIVTMDDILKAVFGRITDEYGSTGLDPEERIAIISSDTFRVPGDIPISAVNGIFNLQLESENFDTIGGWLLEQFGSLPSTGETIRRGNVIYTVEDQAARRIQSVRMTLKN
ncbi:MAG: hemolysin family protein [Bacteroides sp.]|nr:hemolysin family protein [Prevotella sp.]MCM1407654.1 hemolysin family protein [Treponema brennaborense]MCM1469196.1 hemolysin family protein [Bacteroides sp.]